MNPTDPFNPGTWIGVAEMGVALELSGNFGGLGPGKPSDIPKEFNKDKDALEREKQDVRVTEVKDTIKQKPLYAHLYGANSAPLFTAFKKRAEAPDRTTIRLKLTEADLNESGFDTAQFKAANPTVDFGAFLDTASYLAERFYTVEGGLGIRNVIQQRDFIEDTLKA